MNGNQNEPASANGGSSRALLLFVQFAVILAFTAFFANAGMYFPLIVSAAATAYLTDSLKSPLFAAISLTAAFGIAYLSSSDPLLAAQSVAVPLITGVLFVLCKRKSLGLFKSSLIIGAASALIAAAFYAIYLRSAYGNVIEGAKTALSSLYDNAMTQIRNYFSSDDMPITIPENDLKEMLSLVASLLPGIAAALVQIVGKLTYLVTKLYYRIFGNGIKKTAGEYKIPESAVIFFAFSVILALVLSLIKSLRVAELAAINICVALAVPTLTDGVRRIVSRFRNPPTLTMPDGTAVKRPPVFLISVLVISFFISFIFPAVIILIYSVTGTLKEIIKRSVKKNNG